MLNSMTMRSFLFVFFCSIPYFLFSQLAADKVVLQLKDRTFKVSDFEAYCEKNMYTKDSKDKNLEKCLDDYVIYCLKLVEAETQGIDKTPRFKREMADFRLEIATPYLNSKAINEQMIGREWERMKIVHEISNILIPIPLNKSVKDASLPLPEDTLASYKKAVELYDKCINDNYFNIKKDSLGEYQPFDLGKVRALSIPMNLEDAMYSMNVGDISRPIRTRYGYHIIKVNNKYTEKQSAYTEQIKSNIISKLNQTESFSQYIAPSLFKLKEENKFSPEGVIYKELRESSRTLYPLSGAFIAKYENDKRTLFTAQNFSFTVADYIYYLKLNYKNQGIISTDLIDESLISFEYSSLSDVEDRLLESKHPELVSLIDECRKGLLILGITDRETREKAASDTTGMKSFFEQNKANYSWKKPRFKGVVVHSETVSDREQMIKETAGMDMKQSISFLKEKYAPSGQAPKVKIGRSGVFVEGSDEYVDDLIFKSEKKGIPYLEFPRYFVIGKLISNPEEFSDVYSFVLDNYQKYLEKNWINSLKKKYKVKINRGNIN